MPKVQVTTSSSQVIPGNANRKELILDNRGPNAIYLRFVGPVSIAGNDDAGFKLANGERFVIGRDAPGRISNGVWAIAETAASDLVYVEVV